jgi:hypothetical protein
MSNSKNVATVVIIIVAAALIVGLFIYFGKSKAPISSGLRVDLPNNSLNEPILSRELLQALSSVKDLKLDPSFFKDTAFASLIDYTKDISDDPLGRDNPFLPFGSSGEAQATTQTP